MAARSTRVRLVNRALLWWMPDRAEPLNLRRTSMELEHGEWVTKPPLMIGDFGEWESESNGLLTGTEGRVRYQIEDIDGVRIGDIYVHWNNPFSGSNEYHENVTPAATPFPLTGFTILHTGGEGGDAEVTYTLENGYCTVGDEGIACTTSSAVSVEGDRFAGVWERAVGPSWFAFHGLDPAGYQARFDELVGQGFRPTHVSGYGDGGGVRYAGVFEQREGPPFAAFHGLDPSGYQGKFNELVEQGYRLRQVSGYTS